MRIVLMIVLVLALTALGSALAALPVMWCWNYAVVHACHARELTFTHAWALSFMCGILLNCKGSVTSKES